MKIYGSYTDADLDHWQSLPMNSHVLTQSAFGAWLLRRDENKAKQFPKVSLTKVKQARKEMDDLASHKVRPISFEQSVAIDMCINILDKLIEEVGSGE